MILLSKEITPRPFPSSSCYCIYYRIKGSMEGYGSSIWKTWFLSNFVRDKFNWLLLVVFTLNWLSVWKEQRTTDYWNLHIRIYVKRNIGNLLAIPLHLMKLEQCFLHKKFHLYQQLDNPTAALRIRFSLVSPLLWSNWQADGDTCFLL